MSEPGVDHRREEFRAALLAIVGALEERASREVLILSVQRAWLLPPPDGESPNAVWGLLWDLYADARKGKPIDGVRYVAQLTTAADRL